MDSEQKRLLAKQKHMYYENYRKYWKEHGLCQHCGHEKENLKYKTCEKCRARSREYNMRYEEIKGISRKEYIKIYAKERRDRLTAEGLCYVCGKEPPMAGRRLCAKCATDAFERQRRRKKNESAHQQTDRADAKGN